MSTGSRAAKAYIACDKCKQRKKKCNGGLPKCAHCVDKGLECYYAEVRRVRGVAKKDKQTRSDHAEQSKQLELPFKGIENPSTESQPLPVFRTNLLIAKLPPFLAPGSFRQHFEVLLDELAKHRSRNEYMPLLPHYVIIPLVENSFQDTWFSGLVVIGHLDLIALIDRQFIENPTGPGSDPAAWALINAVTSLALRAKTVDGPGMAMSNAVSAYYENATKVMDRLVLGGPSLLSTQALLTMAMAARCEVGQMAASMLVMNAAQLLVALRSGTQVTTSDDVAMLDYLQNVINRLSQGFPTQ